MAAISNYAPVIQLPPKYIYFQTFFFIPMTVIDLLYKFLFPLKFYKYYSLLLELSLILTDLIDDKWNLRGKCLLMLAMHACILLVSNMETLFYPDHMGISRRFPGFSLPRPKQILSDQMGNSCNLSFIKCACQHTIFPAI